MKRDNTLRDKPQASATRRVETHLSHSEKRTGRGSCLVSEWSPVAWEQELSLGGKPETSKRNVPSVAHFSSSPLCSNHLQATI